MAVFDVWYLAGPTAFVIAALVGLVVGVVTERSARQILKSAVGVGIGFAAGAYLLNHDVLSELASILFSLVHIVS